MELKYLNGEEFFRASESLLMRVERESDYERDILFIYKSYLSSESQSYYVSVGKMNGDIQITLFIVNPNESVFGMTKFELYIKDEEIYCRLRGQDSLLSEEVKSSLFKRMFWSSFNERVSREDYMTMVTLMKNIAA